MKERLDFGFPGVTEKLGAIVYKGERAAMIDLFDFDQVICLKRWLWTQNLYAQRKKQEHLKKNKQVVETIS